MLETMNKQILILLLIIIFGSFLRFYRLDNIPVQLNHDEISQLYDLKSIVGTGKDIYGNSYPLAFPSTGDYKPGHYIYISMIPYLLFGDQEVTIRIAAAFFGILTILGTFLFVKILTKNWHVALLASFLIAITPSEIFYSRKSFESIIGVCLNLFGLFYLIKGLTLRGLNAFIYIGILIMTLAMYVYTSYVITVPLTLLLIFFIYWKKANLNRNSFFRIVTLWLICIFPLIFITFTNNDLRFRASSVFLTQDPNLGKLIGLTHNPLKAYFDLVFVKYLNQFNPVFLFVNGLSLTNQTMLDSGPLMIVQFPLIIMSFIFLFLYKEFLFQGKFLFFLILIAMIPSSITFDDFSPHRSVFAFTLFSIISAFGLYWLIHVIITSELNKLFQSVLLGIIMLILTLNLTYFIRIYAFSYPYEKSQYIEYPFKEVSQYIWSQYGNFDNIIFDPKFGTIQPFVGVGAQYYIAYYGNLEPIFVQSEYLDLKDRQMSIGKIKIRQIYWPNDKNLKNILIIGSKWTIPINELDKAKIIHEFALYDGQPALYAIKL
ncbi:MAG: glycosyltransferase family 39 protein [Candidatus Daviesbacteria bacterium]|nr:glycosyltransferase family 39 protein [Candidatus Daviesbacteria bacterium]